MNNYDELLIYEKAFNSFLMKVKRRLEIEIKYYSLQGRKMSFDFSCIGYPTKFGIHGIHYNKQKNMYYFGTQNSNMKSDTKVISPAQQIKIPPILKDTFMHVAETKKSGILRNGKRIELI